MWTSTQALAAVGLSSDKAHRPGHHLGFSGAASTVACAACLTGSLRVLVTKDKKAKPETWGGRQQYKGGKQQLGDHTEPVLFSLPPPPRALDSRTRLAALSH